MRPTLPLLFRTRLLRARRAAFETFRKEGFKVRVVLIMGGSIWAGVLAALIAGLRDLDAYPAFKGLVVAHLLGMFFFLIMTMLFFSSTVVSFGALFDREEVPFLLVRGVSPGDVYWYRLTQAVVFSSWAAAVMGLPVIIAYGVDAGAPWYYYPLACAELLALLLTSAGTGGMAALLAGRFIARYRRALTTVLVLLAAVGALYLAMTLPQAEPWRRSYAEEWLFRILGWFTFSRRMYYPSAWMTRALEALSAGDPGTWAVMFYALSATALLSLAAGRLLAGYVFRRAFEEASGLSVRGRNRWNRFLWRAATLLALGRRRPAAVIYKDLAVFFRDPLQWGQAAVFLGLILIYFVALRKFNTGSTGRLWRLATVDLSFMSVILTISTFTTRFGFPLVSLEVRPPWALVSGMERRRIIRAKVVWTGTLASLAAAGLLVFGAGSLGLSWEETLITAAFAAGAAVALAAAAVGLGAVFPERSRKTPSEMVSSFGGTVTLLFSLVLVTGFVTGYHFAIVEWVRAGLSSKAAPPGTAALAAAAAAPLAAGLALACILTRAGEKALAGMEWT